MNAAFEKSAADTRTPMGALLAAIRDRDADRVEQVVRENPETVNAVIPGSGGYRPLHCAAEVCAAQGLEPEEKSVRVLNALLQGMANPVAETEEKKRASDIVGKRHALHTMLVDFEGGYMDYKLTIQMNMSRVLPRPPLELSSRARKR